jgi:sorting nexin-1/2
MADPKAPKPAGGGSRTPAKPAPAAASAALEADPALEDMNTVDLHGEAKGGNLFPDLAERQRAKLPPSLAVAEGAPEVTVSDPEKKGDGMSAYVVYKVNTKLLTADGKLSTTTVVRRYSDFVWLHTQLTNKNTGWLIPPLPEKALVGRFQPMFVDSRRRSLELFLNRLARHRDLAALPEVHQFLYGGPEFQDLRDGKIDSEAAAAASAAAAAGGGGGGAAAAAPAAGGGAEDSVRRAAKGFLDYLGDVASTVTTTLTGQREVEKTKDDVTCDGIMAYADLLENSVGTVHKNISALTKRVKEISVAWFDFGFACTLLAQHETENEEKALGAAFAKLGSCADRVSVLLSQQVDSQVIHFEEPFHDFLRVVGAVKAMIQARNAVLHQYHNSLASLESKRATLIKYQGKPGKEAKAMQAEKEVEEAQRLVDAELRQLQLVTQRVFAETARFRREKTADFRNTMADFVRMQIDHAKKTQAAWESILADIEGLPADRAAAK